MNQEERTKYIDLGHTQPGWNNLIKELDSKLSILDPNYTILQIKEKFGGLRYYFEANFEKAEEMFKLELEYEGKSFKICEECGSEDDVTTEGSWLKTFCKKCRTTK